jgi:hypothetical protein
VVAGRCSATAMRDSYLQRGGSLKALLVERALLFSRQSR